MRCKSVWALLYASLESAVHCAGEALRYHFFLTRSNLASSSSSRRMNTSSAAAFAQEREDVDFSDQSQNGILHKESSDKT